MIFGRYRYINFSMLPSDIEGKHRERLPPSSAKTSDSVHIMAALSVDATTLHLWTLTQGQVLLIDTRPFMAFNSNHISSSHNVHCPPILKRRSRGTIPLENVVRCPKARSALLESRYTFVVVYDESSTGVEAVAPDSNMAMVLKCLVDDARVRTPYFLEGGFRQFEALFPQLCTAQSSMCANEEELFFSNPSIPTKAAQAGVAMTTTSIICSTSQDMCPYIRDNGDQVVPSMVTVTMETSSNDRCLPGTDEGDPVEVLPWLYLGNAYHAAREERLVQLGISALLNVSFASPDVHPNPHRFCYKHLPIHDSCVADIYACFPEAIAFIDSIRASGGVVLVHCRAGISRSATICLAYLIHQQGLSLDQAHSYLKLRRSRIDPNLSFMAQLSEFERHLRSSGHPFAGDLKSNERTEDSSRMSITTGRCSLTLSASHPRPSCSEPADKHTISLMRNSLSLPLTPCPQRATPFVFDTSLSQQTASLPSLHFGQKCPLLSPS